MQNLPERYLQVPVAGFLDSGHVDQLDSAGFDVNLFHSLPVARAFTPDQLVRLAPVLPEVARSVHARSQSGPVTPEEVLALIPSAAKKTR